MPKRFLCGGGGGFLTWISASDTPKSRFETRSFPPVSTGPPPPARPAPTLPRPGPPPRAAPPRPRPPRPPPARPAPRWLRFSLMISSRDMSILSAMMAAPLRGLHFRPRCADAGTGRGGPERQIGGVRESCRGRDFRHATTEIPAGPSV
uniref:Uncharacterized protein n=1 Tax=Gopherus agassizii TaxID=38772 RepID=A0A452H8C8_9SAUR